ncbi:MAG TPA: ABC transporter permease [bacterium]|nr:ABC transporter permease [bacterium]
MTDPTNVDAWATVGIWRRPSTPRYAGFGSWILIAGLIGLWQLASGHVIDPLFVSKPSAIAARLWSWMVSGFLLYHFEITLLEAMAGFLVGATAGMILGVALGTSSLLYRLSEPIITGLYSLPKVALIPLLVLWFGITIKSKIALAAILVFFLVFYNTLSGVRTIDRSLLHVVQVMGADRAQSFIYIVIPAALSSILLGLRVSLPQAMVGAVVGEIWASSRGLGYLVAYTGSQFDSTGTFAALLALMILSVALIRVLEVFEARFEAWRYA